MRLRDTAVMSSLRPSFNENLELTERVERIRKLCDDLEKALGAADRQRELISQMKRDADDVYKALVAKT
jgi:hypothetical protein